MIKEKNNNTFVWINNVDTRYVDTSYLKKRKFKNHSNEISTQSSNNYTNLNIFSHNIRSIIYLVFRARMPQQHKLYKLIIAELWLGKNVDQDSISLKKNTKTQSQNIIHGNLTIWLCSLKKMYIQILCKKYSMLVVYLQH